MPTDKVLVVGAGVAGSVCAFWLARNGFEVIVVERSNPSQKLGQGIEIEQPAYKVVEAMGIVDELRAVRTGEEGFQLETPGPRPWPVTFSAETAGPTGALEIMRGDLVEVLYKAADKSPNVTYRFDTTVTGIIQSSDKVTVEFQHRKEGTTTNDTFDLVIGADGVRSRIRQLAMGSPEQLQCYKPVGAWVAYFSIPKEERDWPNSRACHFPDSRFVWMRPIGEDSKETSVYLIKLSGKDEAVQAAIASGDRTRQKAAMAELFAGLGWETPRVIEKMLQSTNFYADELTQVKLDKWSSDRVVLLGDSAWAPTPFTGQGNQLAIIGGWVLAQEITRQRGPAAFQAYEKRLRGYVETSQAIPLWGYAPYLAVPQSNVGIFAFRTVLRLISWYVWLTSRKRRDEGVPDSHTDHPFDLQIESMDAKIL